MITPSKKLLSTMEAIAFIAYNSGGAPVSSKEIAGAQGHNSRYLEQILQRLVRAGILRGVRGPRGGYLLARERRRISLGEICEVLLEESQESELCNTPLGNKIIEPVWAEATQSVIVHLKEITLDDLCHNAQQNGIQKLGKDKMDFNI